MTNKSHLSLILSSKLSKVSLIPVGIIEHSYKSKTFYLTKLWKSFIQNSHLLQHQAIHSKVRYFKCFICLEARFSKTKHQLKMHMKKISILYYEKKFTMLLFTWVGVRMTQRQNDTVCHFGTESQFNTATKWHGASL